MLKLWPNTEATVLLGIKYPIIQAPMAILLNLTDTVISTPELVAGISNAGGLGHFGAGLILSNELRGYIQKIKDLTDKPFAVNLAVPGPIKLVSSFSNVHVEETVRITKRKLESFKKEAKFVEVPETEPLDRPQTPETALFMTQIAVILDLKVSILSFSFGVPEYEVIQKLRDANVTLIGTATTVEEALYLQTSGIHLVVAQGFEAGGQRGSFLGSDYTYSEACVGNFALIPQITRKVHIPVLAAGGIMNGAGVLAALVLGASAAVLGTAFLASVESGASPKHKSSLTKFRDRPTVVTRAFTGKPMRVIVNSFTELMGEDEQTIPHYPIQQNLTSPVIKQGMEQDNYDVIPLVAGQGYPLCKAEPCKDIFRVLIQEVETILGIHVEQPEVLD